MHGNGIFFDPRNPGSFTLFQEENLPGGRVIPRTQPDKVRPR